MRIVFQMLLLLGVPKANKKESQVLILTLKGGNKETND